MKDIPIIFSPPMVRAILDNRKTVTRRLAKQWLRVKAGQRLWVRETWSDASGTTPGQRCALYRATYSGPSGIIWKPSIFMPRWASRITLEAREDARVERLQEIDGSEVEAEGLQFAWGDRQTLGTDEERARRLLYELLYEQLWDSLHAHHVAKLWRDNPEVVRIAFRRI